MVVHKGVGVMSKMIRVLLVEPGEHPRLVEVEHTVQNLQKLVGGYIQATYPWDEDRIGLVSDDEGKLKQDYVLNRTLEDYDIIAGSFFLCGLGHEDFISISDELALKYAKKFWMPETFLRTPRGLLVIRDWDGGSEPGEEWLHEIHRPFDE
jgi:hypothetical protein